MMSRAFRRRRSRHWMSVALFGCALGCGEDSGTISVEADNGRAMASDASANNTANDDDEERSSSGPDSQPAAAGDADDGRSEGRAGQPAADDDEQRSDAQTDDDDAGGVTGVAAGEIQDDEGPDGETPEDEAPEDEAMAAKPKPTTPSGEPVFVAVGDGGWLATSCDRGRNWSVQALSETQGDLTHSPWSAFGGIAHGEYGFVAGFGWGSGGHIVHSDSGAGFGELGNDAFEGGSYGQPTAAVAYTGDAYLLFNSKYSVWSSTDGTAFEKSDMTLPGSADQIRQLRAFPAADGLIVAAVENQSGKDHATGNFILSSSDGKEWVEGEGFSPNCASRIQIGGGDITYYDGVLLVAGEQHCRSTDMGATFEQVDKPGDARTTDVFHDATGFVALAGDQLFHSTDGTAWQELGKIGGVAHMGDFGGGTYAAVSKDGKSFYYSDDGAEWSKGKATGNGSGAAVRDIVVGYYDEACP